MKEYILPHYNEKMAQADKIIKGRKGVFDAATFRMILSRLHPDLFQDETNKRRNQKAFLIFNEHKIVLVAEKEMPTTDPGPPVPDTWAEWEEAKRKETERRKAKRAERKAGAVSR